MGLPVVLRGGGPWGEEEVGWERDSSPGTSLLIPAQRGEFAFEISRLRFLLNIAERFFQYTLTSFLFSIFL